MTCRIDRRSVGDGHLFELHGLVDPAALELIRSVIAAAPGAAVGVVLKEGCQIEFAVLDELSRLVELRAESRSLARWIRQLKASGCGRPGSAL